MTETIEEARLRLCKRCLTGKYLDCFYGLDPITSDGSDCPYFREKASVPEGARQ